MCRTTGVSGSWDCGSDAGMGLRGGYIRYGHTMRQVSHEGKTAKRDGRAADLRSAARSPRRGEEDRAGDSERLAHRKPLEVHDADRTERVRHRVSVREPWRSDEEVEAGHQERDPHHVTKDHPAWRASARAFPFHSSKLHGM